MTERYTCPNCSHTIQPSDWLCGNCGANLAIAAALAENTVAKQMAAVQKIPMAPEILVPRLGDYLLEKGVISSDQLDEALAFQKSKSERGVYQLLGQILISKGYLNQSQLDLAITEQIVMLQSALEKSNQQLEQRVAERTIELQNALERLTDLNQLKTNFISAISHELRTPLAHMIGYIELLQEKDLGPLTKDQAHAMGILQRSYDRLSHLIDDLLEFSMASEGQMSLEPAPVDTASLIDSAVKQTQKQADGSKIKLITMNPDPNLQIIADGKKIAWVLEELVENGIKFNKPGGTVQLEANSGEGIVVFSITDDGIGFDEGRIDEVFEPFHQLDGSSTRRYGGTGIGLALAKQIIEAHGTTLKVNSKPGRGTRFEFSLPMSG